VLVNPKAGSGAAARKIPAISRALGRVGLSHDVVETRGRGDAPRLVAEARTDSVDCLAVVGGDGTLNEVCQAYLDHHGAPVSGPALALIPAGTGGDYRRTFGIEDDVEQAVQRLKQSDPRPVDLGALELSSDSGQRVIRAFINIASFGIGGHTDRIVNSSPKWLGGRASFFIGTLRAMATYKNQPVTLKVDGKPYLEAPIFNVAVANGRYFGGGMKIAPDADPGDGLFDVVALHDLTRAQGIALASKIYKGAHLGSHGVRVARGALIEASPLRATTEVLIDMDGETPGRLPLVARVVPGALELIA